MSSIILACGNSLRGDDGIAPYLAHRLYGLVREPDTAIVCSHQWLPEQAEDLSRATLAVFIDASLAVPAGEIQVQAVRVAGQLAGGLTHSVTPSTLMALARDVFGSAPETAFLVTIGGSSFEHGTELSAPVRAAIPPALQQVNELLAADRVQVGCACGNR
ncbi:MAG TPA: hydrogenase maturation protease [Dongiaceae bacterium]|nr:hydrogenase maturation protease [Dongiaceae bacterium]